MYKQSLGREKKAHNKANEHSQPILDTSIPLSGKTISIIQIFKK